MMRIIYIAFFLCLISCTSDKTERYYRSVSENDVKLSKPLEGEWLSIHKEKGQSLDQFIESDPIQPKPDKNTIYLKPIGEFTPLQRKQIALTNEYLEIFFQLQVKTLDDISNTTIPNTARRIGYEENEQLLASYILDSMLVKQKPKTAIAFMGLTEFDLYPKPEWNYVFGQASYRTQVGVSSIYRLQDTQLTQDNFDLCLTRLLKVCSHEIAHMFGLLHCIDAICVMNGSNSLPETDKSPSRLCSNCQRKLNHSLKYDNQKRLAELMSYFKRNKLIDELASLQKDLEKID